MSSAHHSDPKDTTLLVRCDRSTKELIRKAAEVRGLSMSDYMRMQVKASAARDVLEAETGILKLAKEDQIAFWQLLQRPAKPTEAQKKLGHLVRSVS